MSSLIPRSNQNIDSVNPGGGSKILRRTEQRLEAIRCDTMVRLEATGCNGLVAGEKLHEADRLSSVAMGGQAWLNLAVSTLSRNDPLAADDYRYWADMSKLAKTDILMDAVAQFRRI
jgi:hypothetical protein